MESPHGGIGTRRRFRPYLMRTPALLLVLASCVFLTLMGCSQDPEAKRAKYFGRGQQYVAQGKPDEAIIEFRNAIQVAPQFAEAHNALGRAYRQKGWIFDARAAFERAIEIRPDYVDAPRSSFPRRSIRTMRLSFCVPSRIHPPWHS